MFRGTHLWIFRKRLLFYCELSVPHPTPKLEDHPLSSVRDYLLNILAATFHIWRIDAQGKIISHCKNFVRVSTSSFSAVLFIGNKLTRRIVYET
jgi:hypothetical protein